MPDLKKYAIGGLFVLGLVVAYGIIGSFIGGLLGGAAGGLFGSASGLVLGGITVLVAGAGYLWVKTKINV